MKLARPVIATALAGSLALGVGLGLSACSDYAAQKAEAMSATDLTAPVLSDAKKDPTAFIDILSDEGNQQAVFEFSADLLKECAADSQQDSLLISPLSALNALAMVQNGAREETLSQLEGTTGFDASGLNAYLDAYRRRIAGDDPYGSEMTTDPLDVHLANSIWFSDAESLEIERDYLDTCANELGASAYQAPFDDSTIKDINGWVERNTDGMIDEIIESIPSGSRLFLVNALAFDSAWDAPYEKDQVADGTFTCEDGTAQNAKLMSSREELYLENEAFTGFIRPYEGYRFGFVGLLPKDGISLTDAISSIDGASLRALLQPLPFTVVDAALPKFSCEYETSLVEQLAAMGTTDLFDASRANLSGLGSDSSAPLYVGDVKHKTFIDVSEQGTKAAATTSMMLMAAGAPADTEVKTVILDRPFVYMIVDLETDTPIFMGTLSSIE